MDSFGAPPPLAHAGPVPDWTLLGAPLPPAAAPTAHLVGMRQRGEVEAIAAAMADEQRADPSDTSVFDAAVLDTYRWALGLRPAPVTGRTGPVDSEALELEDDTADGLIHKSGSIPQAYAVGVQHAAMWLQGLTDDQPWPGAYTWVAA
ncbi:hypothetical protein [Kitasatospora sp. CB02891]|uniref:hypothetical protein n=1 Tax=Kitasatospora sp. CB02891 TaxID=2020329 RepID=UPI000C276808|nr:hypothetical protein [Kitasatospora sp. CB02891]PJN21116.1 hypothetical protein CG736_34805 [Kitasatospora sp. CB02891]